MTFDATLHSQDASRELKSGIRPQLASEPLPRALFDGLPGLAYVARADRARTIELASAGGHALLGFRPGHKPFPLAPLIHPAERDQVLDVVNSAVANDQSFAIEYRVRHADGEWRTVWDQGRPLRRGRQTVVHGQLLDVTQRLQRERERLGTEHQLLQAQKLHALNQLASGVAHEFNNLIAGILGSAEILAIDLPEKHPGRDSLKNIFEASSHARDFVHKLRTVGQRQPPELKPIHLQAVIEECLQILRTIIPAKVELASHVNPDCPQVSADAAQIHQAILDLCLHLWQGLADRRGRISLTLENCPVVRPPAGATSLLQPGPHVCLTVQDDGAGLEPSTRDNLFHPFRIRRAGAKKIGLELFLVRETVQAHHGEIFVESEPGQGVAFHIYLPDAGEK